MKNYFKRLLGACLAAALTLSLMGAGIAGASGSEPEVRFRTQFDEQTGIVSVTISVSQIRFNVIQSLIKYDPSMLTPCTSTGAEAAKVQDMLTYLAPRAEANPDYRPGRGYLGTGWLDGSLSNLDTTEHLLDLTFMVEAQARDSAWEPGVASDGFMPGEDAAVELVTFYFKSTGAGRPADGALTFAANESGNSVMLYGKQPLAAGGTLETGGEPYRCDALDRSLMGGDTACAMTIREQTPVTPPEDSGTSGEVTKPDSGDGQKGSTTENSKENNGQSTAFSDISNHWARKSILAMAEQGILTGYPDGRFGPNDPLTRGALAAILTRVYHLEQTPATFDDTEGNWASGYIGAVCGRGMMKGVGGNCFAPDGLVSREQLATVLARAEALAADENAAPFADDEEISAWAREGVYAAQKAGLITGYPDGRFGGEDNADRGQVAVILDRIFSKG